MVIFDFDQTLVDTSSLAELRRARRWAEVRQAMSVLEPYAEVTEMLHELHAAHMGLAIVTTSPNMVAQKFAALHEWPIDVVIGYHQVVRMKPDPEGLVKALNHCKAEASTSFHVGDRPEDTEASQRAGITAVGAGWGSEDIEQLRRSAPDYLFMSVADLRRFLQEHS